MLNPDNLGLTIQILTWQKQKVKKGLNNCTRLISEIFFCLPSSQSRLPGAPVLCWKKRFKKTEEISQSPYQT